MLVSLRSDALCPGPSLSNSQQRHVTRLSTRQEGRPSRLCQELWKLFFTAFLLKPLLGACFYSGKSTLAHFSAPQNRRHLFSCLSSNCQIRCTPDLTVRNRLAARGPQAHRRKGTVEHIARAHVTPRIARIVIEIQQPFQVDFQAARCHRVDFAPVCNQSPRQFLSRAARGCTLNRAPPLNRRFVLLLRQLVQAVAQLVSPAKLLLGEREQLPQRRPKPERPVANRQGRRVHPALLQVPSDTQPTLLRFAVAFTERQKMLAAGLTHADHNQQPGLLIADPRRQGNPVREQLDDLRVGERTLAPGFGLDLNLLIQARDGRGRAAPTPLRAGPARRVHNPALPTPQGRAWGKAPRWSANSSDQA